MLYEHDLQQFAEQYPHLHGLDFIEQVLGYFDFACEVADHELEHIPSSGPVVLVANHPIGTLDGMALLRVVAKATPRYNSIIAQSDAGPCRADAAAAVSGG